MKIVKIFSFAVLFFGFVFFAGNFSFANNYEYKSLDITANIRIDGAIDVKETFTTNFFERKHGIVRVIPLNYSVEGKHFHIDIDSIFVNGTKYTTNKNNEELEIKIGDADKTVIGEQIYPIFYSAYGLIRNFSGMGYSELYWNLVGDDFDTIIDSVRAEIYLPKCYTGFTSDDFLVTTDGIGRTVKDFGGTINRNRGDKISIVYNKKLFPGEGITLAVKFPNEYFEFDHDEQASLIGYVGENGNAILNFLSLGGSPWKYFILSGVFIVLIYIFIPNKLPEIKKSSIEAQLNDEKPIVVRYSPPEGISCAEAGMLYNCILEPTDLTSLVYKRLIEGLISVEVDNDTGYSTVRRFVVTKLKNIDVGRPQYEIDFFNDLLPREINGKKALSTTSDFDMMWGLKSLRNYGKSKGWITLGGVEGSGKYFGFFIAIIIFFFLLYLGINLESAIFASVFIYAMFSGGGNSPTQKRIYLTDKGKEIASRVIGYARFIKLCDENKLRLFLQHDPAFFDKTLPYAVAFGFETLFINKITPILRELDISPVWYNGDINGIDSIARIIRTMVLQQELRMAKEREIRSRYDSSSGFSGGSIFSSGGGGFSIGGGGGGGGSRSW